MSTHSETEKDSYIIRRDYNRYKVKLNGADVIVDRYSDGSSTHHFGGPAGSVDYDQNGEEC